MKRIMVATDFSERSDRALRRATLLARQVQGEITLVTAVDEDRPRRLVEEEMRSAETLLREMCATLRTIDNIPCTYQVLLAEPSQAILRAVGDLAPDLLIIGPHRRQLFRDIFIGTTAERIIRQCSCPVLMVNAPPAAPYRHILVTTDLSDGSRDALAAYAALALGSGTSQSLLYVFDAPLIRMAMSSSMPERERKLHIEDERRKAAAALARFTAAAAGAGHFRPLLRHEEASTRSEILASAAESHADLIVLATHGKGGIERLLLGSVTEQVLRDAEIDVLSIPPAKTPIPAPTTT